MSDMDIELADTFDELKDAILAGSLEDGKLALDCFVRIEAAQKGLSFQAELLADLVGHSLYAEKLRKFEVEHRPELEGEPEDLAADSYEYFQFDAFNELMMSLDPHGLLHADEDLEAQK